MLMIIIIQRLIEIETGLKMQTVVGGQPCYIHPNDLLWYLISLANKN